MARPTKLSQRLVKKARKYVAGEWTNDGRVIPTHAGLARFIGVSLRSVERWTLQGKDENAAKNESDLARVISDLNDLQQEVLINRGLSGGFNATVTKLLLARHGYVEKKEMSVGLSVSQAIDNANKRLTNTAKVVAQIESK